MLRFLLIFNFPNLSDDIYRFYWDGQLAVNGINPYSCLPSDLIEGDQLPDELTEAIYDELNSQDYYSIYPPIGQGSFFISALGGSIRNFSLLMKFIYFLAELMCIWFLVKLLKRINILKDQALIYFLNPLVIIEGVGNLHAEVFMMGFFAYFLYALSKGEVFQSALTYVFAISTKLTPLMLGPAILFYLFKRKDIFKFMGIGFIAMMVLFTPLFFGLNFSNLGESVDLYFRKFEFNASIYYIARAVGFQMTGHNQIHEIGPGLAIISLSLILFHTSRVRQMDISGFIFAGLYCYLTYLFFSTTVHPWYLVPLILMASVLKSWTVIIWSFLITLSYYTYSTVDWTESPMVLVIQYLPVYVLVLYEYRKFSKQLLKVEASI